MPTPLDDIIETHEGPEPRVLTIDVQKILRRKIKPGSDDAGESVALIALRSGFSPRTVYRVLSQEDPDATLSLNLADSLCLAADSHLAHCRLVDADGRVRNYVEYE